jgi:hypothetical protein
VRPDGSADGFNRHSNPKSTSICPRTCPDPSSTRGRLSGPSTMLARGMIPMLVAALGLAGVVVAVGDDQPTSTAISSPSAVLEGPGALACVSNATMTPSWCRYRNPFIVPRPPSQLTNASQALVRSPYVCANSSDPFSGCLLVSNFFPFESQSSTVSAVRHLANALQKSFDPSDWRSMAQDMRVASPPQEASDTLKYIVVTGYEPGFKDGSRSSLRIYDEQ